MRWRTPSEAEGRRLDSYLAEHLGEARNQVARWIAEGLVRIDGSPPKASNRLAGNEEIECDPPARDAAAEMTPEDEPLEVLLEDEDFVVVDKPPGLVVHPGAGRESGTLAHRLLHHYPETAQVGGPGRPGVVHRLDRDTSGLLVLARSARGYSALTEAFATRRVTKTYVGIVYGSPSADAGTIDAPIARHPQLRKQMAVREGGRQSVTHYRLRAESSGVAAFELDLETGRTHQIRVHLKHLGHPLVGDPVYGEARWKGLPRSVQPPLSRFSRPALHAWRIAFRHPRTDEVVEIEAPLPQDLLDLWSAVTGEALGPRFDRAES